MWYTKQLSVCCLLYIVGIQSAPQENENEVLIKIDVNLNTTDSLLLFCGDKQYYLGISFKANYFKASEFCRYHGMHLATIDNSEQDQCLEKHLQRMGPAKGHYWLGASDLGQEGYWVWHATGRPVQYSNFFGPGPNNWCEKPNVCEDCLGLWYVEGKGRKWNDFICEHSLNFVCEKFPIV